MPSTPESVGRATLVETLNPWHTKPAASTAQPIRPAQPVLQPAEQTPADPTDLPGITPRAP
eukprot:gene22437-27403_t